MFCGVTLVFFLLDKIKTLNMSKNKLNLTLPAGSVEPAAPVSPSPPVPAYPEPPVIPEYVFYLALLMFIFK